jgi:hypothetical protein
LPFRYRGDARGPDCGRIKAAGAVPSSSGPCQGARPDWFKPILRNVTAAHSVWETELESAESSEVQHLQEELQVALAATHGSYRQESSGASPWSSGSSATSVASFPTRGCTSPGASVKSRYPVAPPLSMAQRSRNPAPGTGPDSQRPQLYYVCYQHGH